MTTVTEDEALDIIDSALQTTSRSIITGDEVRDLLLDIRRAITRSQEEAA